MSAADRLELVVAEVRCEARDVLALDLSAPGGVDLPPFTPGSHLEVYLPGGLIRHYSLCNDSRERHRYSIGVGLARDSRGGSRYIHQNLRTGTRLTVSAPRNNFPMEPNAPEYVFIAGGIGITPILSMIRQCIATHKRWKLYYCCRNRQRAGFYEELAALEPGSVHFHFDDEQEGRLFDASAALESLPDTAHIYTCGPGPLMTAVQTAAAKRPQDRVHFEWFTAAAVETSSDKAFTVVLKASGKRFEVPPGRSILEVLEDNDAGVPYSCREGLCATCRTCVISGIPEHRDSVLSATERESNKEMMICVSRSKTDVLELDL